MKLAQVRFSKPVPHPALGGESKSRMHFRCVGHAELGDTEEAFEIEDSGRRVLLTCKGVTRRYNDALVDWDDPMPAEPKHAIAPPVKHGGKR